MRKFYGKKIVTAVLFLIFLFSFSFYNTQQALPKIKETVRTALEEKSQPGDIISLVEAVINDKVYDKYIFIEAYGYLQKLMDKHETNNFEIVKDVTGKKLYYTNFATGTNEVSSLVDSMDNLSKETSDLKTKVIYLMTPDKYLAGYTKYETGIPYNYANETADLFLDELGKKEIDYLDYRDSIMDSEIETEDLFFDTDHHWKVPTTFWAFTQLVNKLEDSYGVEFKDKDYYSNLDNYNQITYKDSYIGSQGKKMGILYSGVEDFTLIYPKFETSYFFYSNQYGAETSVNGRFEDALMMNDVLTKKDKDIYDMENDKYYCYLNGNCGFVQARNNNLEDGLKVLFIKDSMISPMAAFFTSFCSDVYMIDPRYYGGDIDEFVKEQDLDYVFVSFDPQNLTADFFKFGN
ncbi:MAG: hypothetical protein ACERKN_22115 [Velocimicrobium sp.]